MAEISLKANRLSIPHTHKEGTSLSTFLYDTLDSFVLTSKDFL